MQPRYAPASAETFRTGFRLNLLDENFPRDQLPLLKEWHIPFRRIGQNIARPSVKDPDIVPLLHEQHGVTFFALDWNYSTPRCVTQPMVWFGWMCGRMMQRMWCDVFSNIRVSIPKHNAWASWLARITRGLISGSATAPRSNAHGGFAQQRNDGSAED
jgi:hypothetical protein